SAGACADIQGVYLRLRESCRGGVLGLADRARASRSLHFGGDGWDFDLCSISHEGEGGEEKAGSRDVTCPITERLKQSLRRHCHICFVAEQFILDFTAPCLRKRVSHLTASSEHVPSPAKYSKPCSPRLPGPVGLSTQ